MFNARTCTLYLIQLYWRKVFPCFVGHKDIGKTIRDSLNRSKCAMPHIFKSHQMHALLAFIHPKAHATMWNNHCHSKSTTISLCFPERLEIFRIDP